MAQKRIDIGFVNPVYRGEWGSTTEYKPLDMIRFNNCLYMAKVNTVGDDPDKMTVRTASYTVGDVWCANVLWLHPMRDDMTNNYVNMLTVVPSGGRLWKCDYYASDKTDVRTDTGFTDLFSDITKGY